MAESTLINDPEPVFKNTNWTIIKFDVKTFSGRCDMAYFTSLSKKTGECCEMYISTDQETASSYYHYYVLRVYPNGKNTNYKDYVSVFLLCVNKHYTFKTRYSIELRDSSDNVIVFRNCEYAEFPPNSEHGVFDVIKRDTLQKALEKSTNGTLTVLCTIKEFTNIRNEAGPSDRPIQKPKEAHLTYVLKTMLSDQVYTDFTINVKGRQFKVHKAVLYTCSPVFAKMLSIQMKEREKNETSVDDVEPEVFEKIVEFMYTGSVATIDADAMDLVPVAHKYDLKGLLEQCEAALCSKISTLLAVKLLVLSNLYSLQYLKIGTVKYMKANLNGISQRAEWKTDVVNNPALLMLLLMP